MQAIVGAALQQRILVLILAAALIAGGLFAYKRLNIEAYPDPVPPLVDIVTQNPGQSSDEIERYITIPIEVQMAGIPFVTSIRTISLTGLSDVKVQFSYDVTYPQASQSVTNRLSQLGPLPNGAQPFISPTSPIGEIFRYRVVGPPGYSVTDLKTIQDWILLRRLKSVSGVIDVTTWGGKSKTFDITVDLDKLLAYGITLKQVLFDGQVFVGLQARQTSLDYYRKSQELTEQNLRVNINKIYYQLLLSRTQIALIDANISRAQELLHNTTEMFKNGFAERLDVDKATVQLTNLQSEKVQTLYNIDDGYLGLKVLMGMPIRDSLTLTDTLTYDMVREGVLADDYKYTDRRDYQLLQINKKLNEFDISRYKKMYIPTASLTGNYAQNGYGLDFSDITGGKFWYGSSYVGLNINVPIFDGFNKSSNIRKSKLVLQQTQNNLEAMQITIDNDVRQAQLKFGAALASLDYEKKNMDLAGSVYDQTRKKFEQGLGSNTEITSAQTDLVQAQNNYFNALYNAVSAKIDYQNAIGKL